MIIFEKIDESKIRVTSPDVGALLDMSDYFTFLVPGHQFVPSFKNKMWDGKIRLLNLQNHTLPAGLLKMAVEFCKSRNHEFHIDPKLYPLKIESDEALAEFVKSLNIHSDGKKITPRDYQLEAFRTALHQNRAIILSPTGSGKSLIIYMLLRYYLSQYEGKVLVIVPTTSLVEQMHNDFVDYSSHDPTFSGDDVHRIYSGKEKFNIESNVVVTTWQSAMNLPKSWFQQFGMVLGDEAHLFVAKSLNKILNNLSNAMFRIGTTGTLDGAKCHELNLIGNFGDIFNATTTRKLMDRGDLAELKIKCLSLKHDKELCKIVAKCDYKSEIDVIVSHPQRNKLITNLAKSQKGNTLVLFNYVKKHGKPLYEMIKEACPDRDVFFVSGEVKADARNEIRALTEKSDGAIIVASLGTFSTGISIKNLHNIIFASPSKSTIKVLQSIGRGLRKAKNGQGTVLYDITDDFRHGKRENFTFKHGRHRVGIYDKQQFDYSFTEMDLPYNG